MRPQWGGMFFLWACLSLPSSLIPSAVTPQHKVSLTTKQLSCLIIYIFPFLVAILNLLSGVLVCTIFAVQLRKSEKIKTNLCFYFSLFPGKLYENTVQGRGAPGTSLGPVSSTWNWNMNWPTFTRRTPRYSSPPALSPMTPPSSPSPRCYPVYK